MSVPQRRSLYDCLNDRLRADARLGLARDSAAMAGGAAGPLLHRDGREYVSFMSNDGLGLAADAHWQARVAACFAAHAPSASASRLAGGRSDVVDRACRAVADYFGFAECLFLPSGYQGNLACVTTLLQQGQEAFVDRRCHASVMRALPLAGARIRAWNHLDYDHLERLLSSLPPDAPQPVVMAESLYSMDGAALDLERMAALRRRYGFFLCVDEAHALGALGPGGRGLCAAQALRDGGRAPADLVVGTLGKSLGLWGAFLLLPPGFTPLFEHLASAIMHSTALPPAHAACMLALVEELPRLEERRRTLAARVAFFRQALTGRGLPVMGDAQARGQRRLVGQGDKAADILQIDLYHNKYLLGCISDLPYITTFPAKIQGEFRYFFGDIPPFLSGKYRHFQKVGEHPSPAAPRRILRRQYGHRH